MRVAVLRAPAGLVAPLGTLPEGVEVRHALRPGGRMDLVVAFVTWRERLARDFGRLIAALPSGGALWVAWPKRASGLATDMSDGAVRQIALPAGWVDVKVCAVDATWTALKLVQRKRLRTAGP